MKLVRDLELKLIVEDGRVAAEAFEPETRAFVRYSQNVDNLSGLIEDVGREIVSWFYLMLDERYEEER